MNILFLVIANSIIVLYLAYLARSWGGNKMIALIWVLSGMVSVCVIVMVKEFRDGE